MASKNCMQCSLCTYYGCTDTFFTEEQPDHDKSEIHRSSMKKILEEVQRVHEDAIIQETINPGENSGSISLKLDHVKFMLAIIHTITEHMPKSNESMSVLDRLPTLNPNLSSTSSLVRNSIIEEDRNLTPASNRQLLQEQKQLNEASVNLLLSRIVSPPDCSDANNGIQQNEQHTNASSATPSNDVEAHLTQLKLLKCQLDEKPVSTDGTLVWHIDKLTEKIRNATSLTKLFINSYSFKTPMNDLSFFARLYLNGKSDHKNISFHVHLNFPVTSTFSGNVKFILVDQSNSPPLEHIMQSCQGQMNFTNDSIGLDNFIDKQHLHQASSRYIRDDAADFIVLIQQTNEEKFSHYPPNIQQALLQYQSIT
ncbi:unnamed protein product [Rotaria socialis]|uniref:MATH domain-containing protein n=1 Tax=Rotaria socialis TaxID=392032 RepID=A0A818N8X5_9BILA|nr:unnamed protein product [Rotaria socialis]CAF4788675.1 unnamed protein product [Rotaria socialis]